MLQTDSSAGHLREVELTCAGKAWVFAQTLIPERTLARQPWLTTLGSSALGARLADVPGIRRGPLEFAELLPGNQLYDHALRGLASVAVRVWARRSWFAIGEDRLLVQEVFLPAAVS